MGVTLGYAGLTCFLSSLRKEVHSLRRAVVAALSIEEQRTIGKARCKDTVGFERFAVRLLVLLLGTLELIICILLICLHP